MSLPAFVSGRLRTAAEDPLTTGPATGRYILARILLNNQRDTNSLFCNFNSLYIT